MEDQREIIEQKHVWGLFRRRGIDWWINFFKDLRDSGLLVDECYIHKECIKFCFMRIIQNEHDKIASHWNIHSSDISVQTKARKQQNKANFTLEFSDKLNHHIKCILRQY